MAKSALHAAIIMDGNGRWAKLRGLPRLAGHQAGAEALRRIVEVSPYCGIATLTTYAFSSDNWKRPPEEVAGLLGLIAAYLLDETPRFAAHGVRVTVIGRRDRLPHSLLHAIAVAESETAFGARLRLQLAVDYSARDAILRAANDAFEERSEAPLTQEGFETLLAGTPGAVDLLIRTGGEQRLSDFLLWECAYAELVFTRCMWPDFDEAALRNAVTEYRRRDRRFGAVPTSHESMATACVESAPERWLR